MPCPSCRPGNSRRGRSSRRRRRPLATLPAREVAGAGANLGAGYALDYPRKRWRSAPASASSRRYHPAAACANVNDLPSSLEAWGLRAHAPRVYEHRGTRNPGFACVQHALKRGAPPLAGRGPREVVTTNSERFISLSNPRTIRTRATISLLTRAIDGPTSRVEPALSDRNG